MKMFKRKFSVTKPQIPEITAAAFLLYAVAQREKELWEERSHIRALSETADSKVLLHKARSMQLESHLFKKTHYY